MINKEMWQFQPVNILIHSLPETDFSRLIMEGVKTAEANPHLLTMIDHDLDVMALEKKQTRLEDQNWHNNKTLPLFEIDQLPDEENNVLHLSEGRPRMPPLMVLIFILLRGYLGGVKTKKNLMTLLESQSLYIFLINMGYKMPGASTIIENTNAVSVETYEAIHSYQIQIVKKEELDNFKELTTDSTSISANSAWPVDSIIIMKLICRITDLIKSLTKHGISSIKTNDIVDTMIKEVKDLNRKIEFSVGKKDSANKRKKMYNKLYRLAKKILKHLKKTQEEALAKIAKLDIPPSKIKILQTISENIKSDFCDLELVIDHSSKRINEEKQTPSSQKVLSLSDEDASIIAKGQRDPVIGYKPQICRSGNGFIAAIIVPKGNANDSGQMKSIVDKAIKKTGVIPDVLSFDDGYVNSSVRNKYLEMGISVVSFSGSKGKKIIPIFEYDSDKYKEARRKRSAVESLMFVIKHNENFGQVMRRGLEQTRAESLEKVLVHNFFRIIELRARKNIKIKEAS